MKRFFNAFAVAAAAVAVALMTPVSAWAACPGNVPFGTQGLASVITLGPNATQAGGTYWIAGGGLDAIGPGGTEAGFGNDAGQLAGFPIVGGFGEVWLFDFFGDGTSRIVNWDWASAGSDGCGDGLIGNPMVTVVRDDVNNFAIVQVAPAASTYDWDLLTTGPSAPSLALGRAVHVTSSADVAGKVQVNVAALNLTAGVTRFDDQGGTRPVPGTPRLKGILNGSPSLVAGGGGGAITVDPESNLCWELVDAGYTATLGCIRVGTSNAAQNLANGKADFAKGGAHFSWDVTAQFDVLGFNIYQKDVTKGTERKVNATLIPLSGENDATPESYAYVAPRRDLRAVKGGFEIELVRQNGETIRGSVQVTR